MRLTQHEEERAISHFNSELHEVVDYEVIEFIEELRACQK